ncbi:NADP oxidoreductase [Zoogloea sp.]|uniref:NADH-quinone oxidoreductase subunit B family protein n=1 Tax=Zoogloea sp. TaxID=49181 RepID=UPI0035B42FED
MSLRPKPRIATVSLGGCFGCHMSLLDMDEQLFELLDQVELDRSPLTDIKTLAPCDIGLIEGGLCNAENVHLLQEFRVRCRILVAVGACAINGGLPAQRNTRRLGDCLREVYQFRPGLVHGQIPNDPELPLLLDQVRPLHEVVQVDYSLPGCPPSGEALLKFISDLLAGHPPRLTDGLLHYD